MFIEILISFPFSVKRTRSPLRILPRRISSANASSTLFWIAHRSGLARYTGLQVHSDPRLREGVLGCPKEENPIHTLRQWHDFDYRLPEGESLRQVEQRMLQCLKEILVCHRGENIVVSTHGTAISSVIHSYNPAFGWKEAKAVKRAWPWILRLEYDQNGTFLGYTEMVREHEPCT